MVFYKEGDAEEDEGEGSFYIPERLTPSQYLEFITHTGSNW